jgi:hypothetical protein
MAELIGVVASGISIAQLTGQIANSLVKLRGYWDQVKDAPDEIWNFSILYYQTLKRSIDRVVCLIYSSTVMGFAKASFCVGNTRGSWQSL